MPKHSLRGVPDIILIKQGYGQFVGLEVKRKDGNLSVEQMDFRDKCAKIGAGYYVVRSIEDVQALGL